MEDHRINYKYLDILNENKVRINYTIYARNGTQNNEQD